MKKAIAMILTMAVGLVLMIYSASRTLSLLQMTLPPGQKDMAFLALAAFDGGLIAWGLVFMFGAEGGFQRGISLLMGLVSLVGVIIGFGADQVIGATHGGLVSASDLPPGLGLTATLATVAIIALHIAAIYFFHMLSPENRRRMQEEGFNDKIEDEAMKKSDQQIKHLAADLSEVITASRMAQLNAIHRARISSESLELPSVSVGSTGSGLLEAIKQRLSATPPDGNGGQVVTLGMDSAAEASVVPAPKGKKV